MDEGKERELKKENNYIDNLEWRSSTRYEYI